MFSFASVLLEIVSGQLNANNAWYEPFVGCLLNNEAVCGKRSYLLCGMVSNTMRNSCNLIVEEADKLILSRKRKS